MKNSELSLWRAEMTSKYDIRTLGELSVGNKGSYGIAASAVEYSEDLFTYLRISDITDDGRINKNDLKSVKEQNAKDYLLKPNDIVFARTGGSTGRNYFYDGKDGQFVYAGFLIKFSINPQKVNPKYIKYYCQSKIYRDWVHSFNTGSTRGNINAQTYSQLPIILPPRTQQDILVKMLSSLDDKIELNNKINQNLEQQAQAIFKSWFVDFEPFGGKMPEDWSLKILSDISNITAGGDKPDIVSNIETEECKIPIYSNGIDNNGLYGYTTEPKILQESVTVSARGTIGFTCLRLHPYVPIVRLISLIPRTDIVSAKYLYFSLLNKHITGTGTTQQQLTVPYFKTTPIIVPTFDIVNQFTEIVNSFYKIIEKNICENKRLIQLRDTLLPKLMSGEIDVDKVEV